MKKLAVLFAGFALLISVSTVLAGNGAVQGEAGDLSYPGLGIIRYLGNKPGYHFWFTPKENIGPYVAGHSYHNVYKLEVGDTSEWCGPVNIPNRAPYNLVGHTGKTAYYKIWDKTTDTLVCP